MVSRGRTSVLLAGLALGAAAVLPLPAAVAATPTRARSAPALAASSSSLAASIPTASASTSPGYRLAGTDGNVYAFGASFAGSMKGTPLTRPVVGIASTTHFGYWMVASDGGIFTFGDAHFYGSTGAIHLNQPIVGMAHTLSGQGYWLVAADGGIFTFGDARFYGSTGAMHLNKPIVGMSPTPSGHGYWLVASDGGIFTFGDARFFGSTGAMHLNQPIVGMTSTPAGQGYRLVAADGGIFTFGSAPFFGSMGGSHVSAPIVGMVPTVSGQGYDMAGADGAVYSFGDAHNYGSAWGRTSAPIVGIATATNANPYQPGSTGYDISWPQCGPPVHLPAAPHPVTVVGVNYGHMFSTNPCLASELAWAGPTLTVYVNANPLPSDSTSGLTGPAGNCAVGNLPCRAYNYGRQSADYDAVAGANAGVHTSMWWLDVELNGGWLTQNAGINTYVIQGLIDGLRSRGYTVGVYSTHYQWGFITGGASLAGTPIWVPTGSNNSSLAVQYCSPSHGFGGGITWLTQWTVVYDQDYACPQ